MSPINKTPQNFLDVIRDNKDHKGVGIIVYHDRTKAFPFRKEFLDDISYKQLLTKGVEAYSYKFLPYGITIRLKHNEYVLNSLHDYVRIPKNEWVCSGRKCGDREDCYESAVCDCIEGICF